MIVNNTCFLRNFFKFEYAHLTMLKNILFSINLIKTQYVDLGHK